MFSIERRDSETFLIIMNFTSCIWFFQKSVSIMFSLTRFSPKLFFSLSLFTLWSEKFWRKRSLINLLISDFSDDRFRFWSWNDFVDWNKFVLICSADFVNTLQIQFLCMLNQSFAFSWFKFVIVNCSFSLLYSRK